MNVDIVNVVKMVIELYTSKTLPVTELQRYWSNIRELRDLFLTEIWKPDSGAVTRNDELIEVIKRNLLLPLSQVGGSKNEGNGFMQQLEMVNVAAELEQGKHVFIESLLGIDLELQGKDGGPIQFMRHPWVSRDSTWYRGSQTCEGFFAVEQSLYWEVSHGITISSALAEVQASMPELRSYQHSPLLLLSSASFYPWVSGH